MILHRVGGDAQMAGNFLVAQTCVHELQNLHLTLSQARRRDGAALSSETADIAKDQLSHATGRRCLVISHHLESTYELGERLGADNICAHTRLDIANDVGIADLCTQKYDLGAD